MRTRYPAAFLASDAIAGLTLWTVFAAQAIAYSRLAHATVTAGVVTAIAGAAIYALLGSSRRISIGPAGGIAAIVGAAVADVPAPHVPAAIAVLTLATGAFLCVAGLLRISFLPRLFPTPVFVGYLAGTGVTILIGQGKDLIASTWAFAIGAVAIAGVLAFKRFAPRIPGPFVVLAVATVASLVFGFADRGVPVIGESLGHFTTPSLPRGLGWEELRSLLPAALGLALIVYVDGLANANMLVQADDPAVQPRREYFAFGVSSLLSGLFGGFVTGTSSSRSIVGIRAGEKSRLAGAIAGVLMLLTALSAIGFLAPMPLPALAGVVFVAAIDLIDRRRLREMFRLRRADFWIAMFAAAAVVFVGMVEGIVIGIVAALIEVFRRAMYPNRSVISDRGGDRLYEPFTPEAIEHEDDVLVYRFGTGMFFGNAESFRDDMREIASRAGGSLRRVIVNADGLGVPDATARDCLIEARATLAKRGIELVFGNARKVLRDALARIGGFTLIGEAEFLAAVKTARLHGRST